MKEIIPPSPQPNTSKTCPKCNGPMRRGPVACPDGRIGCCVAHYGYTCLKCGAMFQ